MYRIKKKEEEKSDRRKDRMIDWFVPPRIYGVGFAKSAFKHQKQTHLQFSESVGPTYLFIVLGLGILI